MLDFNSSTPFPEGVISFLDTDLYKLTMQCAVLKYHPDVPVTYAFTNRTPEKKLSRKAFEWLRTQISKLGNISLSDDELRYLQTHCNYLSAQYLDFLKEFRLSPREQIVTEFQPIGEDTGSPDDIGDFQIHVRGKWVDTILYEIPLLALTSEAYFRFMDTEWSYDGQEEQAFNKGMQLLEAGCITSEFGTRRRRDYHTQALVFRGLVKANQEGEKKGFPGKISGTSNVHLAMRFNIPPIGTVAHEWFMGTAAIENNYQEATEKALQRWVGCFGEGVLGIALTDTFGTPAFLKAFSNPIKYLPDTPNTPAAAEGSVSSRTYAEVFSGVRQDSGDPAEFVKIMRKFYDSQGIKSKTIVFSDSLNIEKCIEYKKVSEEAGLAPTFGVGTFLTNDFTNLKTGKKSSPMNIVIKLSSADGNPAIKISDNAGKNTGDQTKVDEVKKQLGYQEKEWEEGDETARWGK
ncbi:nicotinate phosphoribosyltransferase [Apiospora saccharicola]|uniref:nicotinate phosphoribosyltransferase n=1 Tax=Apiospora saccharicola TaxID=335842 RepID=A0ABR1TI29_9PEZI